MCTVRPVVVRRAPRLRAPKRHLEILVWPEPPLWPALLEAPEPDTPLLDTSLASLRDELRAALGLAPPVIATGHQCELFHAGVFAKLIAASQLTERFGGSAAYVLVDSDTPKATHLLVPTLRNDEPHVERVAIPSHEPHVPAELQPREPPRVWRAFFERVRQLLPGSERTLLPQYARDVHAGGGDPVEICAAVLAAQDGSLAALGLRSLRDVRISELAETRAFRALVAHLLLHARAFAEHYNAARDDFRAHHRVRSANRPVAPLGIEPQRVELPLWVYREPGPRLALWVEPREDRLVLCAGREPIAALPREALTTAAGAERWLSTEALNGWRLRPRALTLSLFVRLFLADVFIHGIGGMRYDEMTEQFSQGFFGFAPLPAGCVTATVHVALPYEPVREDELRAARRALRDVHYNPQRHLTGLPAKLLAHRQELIERSARLRRERPDDHAERRRVYLDLHAVNARLLASASDQVEALHERVARLEQAWAGQRIATSREYFYALCRSDALQTLTRRLAAAWDGKPAGGQPPDRAAAGS